MLPIALRKYGRRRPAVDPTAHPINCDSEGGSSETTPARLGKYRILGTINQGSMGVIYRSIDPESGRPLALKVLRQDLVGMHGDEWLARLQVEAQAGSRLSHPGIVRVHGFAAEGRYAYLAMEYVDGMSLRQRLKQGGAWSIADSVDMLSQLLVAVQHAHDRGVWHRDIKPANILLADNGRIKLADFGIARISSASLMQPDSIMGTPGFIAPETYLTDTFDSRVDVYAAGAVLYEMLTGVPPFVGTADQMMFKACYEDPAPPSLAACRPYLRAADAVVLKSLARRPEERYTTASEFLAALRPLSTLRQRSCRSI